MIGPISRILIRYLVGALVMFGVLLPDDAQHWIADPDVYLIVSGILAFSTEFAYGYAKKKGWTT